MDERLNLITLGVRDVSRARAFYEALAWHLDGGVDDESDHVAFFQTPSSSWRVGPGEARRRQRGRGGRRWGGVTLAYNVRSPDEVDGSSSGLRMRRSRSTISNNSYKRTSSPTWMRSQ